MDGLLPLLLVNRNGGEMVENSRLKHGRSRIQLAGQPESGFCDEPPLRVVHQIEGGRLDVEGVGHHPRIALFLKSRDGRCQQLEGHLWFVEADMRLRQPIANGGDHATR